MLGEAGGGQQLAHPGGGGRDDVRVSGVVGQVVAAPADLQEHRDWVERVCNEAGMKAILPLWNADREILLKEFVEAGFRASVVAVNESYLGKEWLGREIDDDFVKELKKKSGIDLCGERGEYHTFVYDGPIFKKKVEFSI